MSKHQTETKSETAQRRTTKVSTVRRIKVGRYVVSITNENRVLFPETGLTKGDLIRYYERVAPIMLTHVRRRPISMQRFPDGITHPGFFHKDAPAYFPPWVARFAAHRKDESAITYVVCNNAATLVYLAHQACITIHTWPATVDAIHNPDRIVFDLDPPDGGAFFGLVQETALRLRGFLAEHALHSFVMTTGSRGLHVVVPIKRHYTFDIVHNLAGNLAKTFAARNPHKLTVEMHKQRRGSRIFIDTMRTAYGQTSVAPYAVRARPNAPVATPLDWHELPDPHLRSDTYTMMTLFTRLELHGDPWRAINTSACNLKAARECVDTNTQLAVETPEH